MVPANSPPSSLFANFTLTGAVSYGQDDDLSLPILPSGARSPQSRTASFDSIAGTSPPLEMALPRRKTSISFDPQVTLDSGKRLSIDDPLPRSDLPRSAGKPIPNAASRTSSVRSGRFHFPYDADDAFAPPRGRPSHSMRYRDGDMRHPLLQTTIDSLAREASRLPDDEPVASLTSAATASTYLEEARTPLERSTDLLNSPLPISSPIEFPSSNPFPFARRTSSQRSRSYRSLASSVGSLRKSSRRSTRSGTNTSISPAGAFLAQWGGREEAASIIEPDDEGQEIGDHSEYIIGRQIGYGGFSVVKEVYTIEDGQKVKRAVKIVRKQISDLNEMENERLQSQFEHEVSIWRFLSHQYILSLIAVYDSPFATFCITKLNVGGTLFDLVRNHRKTSKQGLQPAHAKRYIYQLCSAIRYLHEDHHLVHRDIKLENCLLDMSGPNAEIEGGNVLLCDFGMADYITNENRASPDPYSESPHRRFGSSETSTSIAGSLMYAAPELFRCSYPLYSTAIDMWAFGVVSYALLTSLMPFHHSFDPKIAQLIQEGDWDITPLRNAPAVLDLTNDPIDLVQGCLEMEPSLRWSVRDALECDWLEGCKELYEDEENIWA